MLTNDLRSFKYMYIPLLKGCDGMDLNCEKNGLAGCTEDREVTPTETKRFLITNGYNVKN